MGVNARNGVFGVQNGVFVCLLLIGTSVASPVTPEEVDAARERFRERGKAISNWFWGPWRAMLRASGDKGNEFVSYRPDAETPALRRPRIKPWILVGWHHKDMSLQRRIKDLNSKIERKKYKVWLLEKHKPMSEEAFRREWGILAAGFRDPAARRAKQIEKLQDQKQRLEIRKRALEQEMHDFKEYLKKEWRWRSKIASEAKYRPKERYPSFSKMWDDQPAMADRNVRRTWDYRTRELLYDINTPFRWARNTILKPSGSWLSSRWRDVGAVERAEKAKRKEAEELASI